MKMAALVITVGLMGFTAGLTFQPTAPATLAVSGIATAGWAIATWLAGTREPLKYQLKCARARLVELIDEKNAAYAARQRRERAV